MPECAVNGTTLHVEDSGEPAGPSLGTIIFSHGLLMNCAMFAPQIEILRQHYRCISYDHRGQGQSAPAATRCIEIDTVTADAAALIETLGVAPVHFCGLSMGGFVGLRLAIRRPELLRSLIILDSSADPEPLENVPKYRLLNFLVRWLGVRPLVGQILPIMFGHSFLADPNLQEDRAKARAMLSANRRDIWRAVNGVIERQGVRDQLGQIGLPTLILVGEEDKATVPAKAEAMQRDIAGAKLVVVPRAGHSSTLENPADVTKAMADFLESVI